jgi:hypothetical protein
MGLGMFFKQYLAPLLASQSQQNSSLIQAYGNTMNQMMNQAGQAGGLPPGIAQILKTTTPQNQMVDQMLNQSAQQQALGAIPYQQFIQGVGGQSSAMQALTDAFLKAATAQEINVNPTSLGGVLGQILGSNTTAGGLASILSQGSTLPGLSLPGAAGANSVAGAGYTPPTTSTG